MGREVVEIGLAVCASCSHGRSEHEFCSDDFPALCIHNFADEDEGYYGICTCMQFVTEEELTSRAFPKPSGERPAGGRVG